jgi:hyperosmotically inducible protein
MKQKMSNLQLKVQRAILEDARTREIAIEVLERNGVITLKGVVPSREVSEIAESLASDVFGVRGVINELEIAIVKETGRI